TVREQLQAAIMELQAAHTGDSRSEADAWERVNKLAERDDPVGLDSLVLLAQRQLSSSGTNNQEPITDNRLEPAELVRRLATHPLSKAPQKLLAIDLQLQAKPDEKETLIAAAIAQWKDADTDSLVALARWLNGKGEF